MKIASATKPTIVVNTTADESCVVQKLCKNLYYTGIKYLKS